MPCRRCPQAWHRRCLPPDLPRNREVQDGARVWLADCDEQQGGLMGVRLDCLWLDCHCCALQVWFLQVWFLLSPGALATPRALPTPLIKHCCVCFLPSEAWLDGVETSLLYCKRHPMDPDTGQAKFVRRLRKAAERGQAKGQVSCGSSAHAGTAYCRSE